ncbi:MAG: ABC transporter permease [Acidobacteriia bacterium]|nr:ABC transporter permease [Terriglobia bacterium]
MKPPRAIRGLIWQSALVLRAASLLVPRAQRAEWYREWHAELWHRIHFLHESGRLTPATQMELARDCWGSFADAAWLRFDREKVLHAAREAPRTARFCLVALALALVVVLLGSGFAPTIRTAFASMPYSQPDRLAELSFFGNSIYYPMDNLFNTVPVWEEKSATTESAAGYSWYPSRIVTTNGSRGVVSARVSPGFFDVLGVKPAAGRLFRTGDEHECARCVVISHHAWTSAFQSDPSIVGKHIVLGDKERLVIGVLPSRFRFVSPETAVWTVTSPEAVGLYNFADHSGVVLRLRPGVTVESAAREYRKFVQLAGPAFGSADFNVASINSRMRQGVHLYVLFTLVTFIGSLVMLSRHFFSATAGTPLRLAGIARWWAFFAVKTLLLLLTCFVGSIEGVRLFFLSVAGSVPAMAGAISTWVFLITTILALTWSLKDQRHRCRNCLCLLTHEAYVGVPGYLFLDYWGTELVCSHGHGLLHVPQMDACWLEENHWTELDPSWKPLFESEEVNVL